MMGEGGEIHDSVISIGSSTTSTRTGVKAGDGTIHKPDKALGVIIRLEKMAMAPKSMDIGLREY